ncbi:MAG TPA: hypothetical protein VIM55_08450 [Mucilaginibacter sp.]
MRTINQPTSELSNEIISEWFNKYISDISVDKMMMENDIASTETRQFYTDAISGNQEGMHNYARIQSSKYFISKIVNDYFKELQNFKAEPKKLAFSFSEAKILVWAEIADEDESTEDALILSEAKANEKYSDNGFFVTSTIVETRDHLNPPSHYHEIKIDGRLSGAHSTS